MTRKNKILLFIGAIFIVVALAIALIFIFSDDINQPTANPINIKGNWIVVAEYNNDTPTFAENQFMVFDDNTATVFKSDLQNPYATSGYSIDAANQLLLPDISRNYKLERKTDSCIRLYENTTKYLLLVKDSDSALDIKAVDNTTLSGSWNVIMKGEAFNNGESLNFVGDTLEYIKTPGAEPAVSTKYSISKNVLLAESINLKMKCFFIDEKTMIFVEDGGIVWELTKAITK